MLSLSKISPYPRSVGSFLNGRFQHQRSGVIISRVCRPRGPGTLPEPLAPNQVTSRHDSLMYYRSHKHSIFYCFLEKEKKHEVIWLILIRTLTCARLAVVTCSGDEENNHVNNNIIVFCDIRDALKCCLFITGITSA